MGRLGGAALLGGFFLATLVIAGLAAAYSASVVSVATVLLPLVVWAAFRRSFNAPFASPSIIVTGIITAIGVFGYILREVLANEEGDGASIFIVLPEDMAYRTITLISSFAAIVIATAGVCLWAARKSGAGGEVQSAGATWSAKRSSPILLLVASVPALLMLFDTGVTNVFIRTYYLVGEAGTLLGGIGFPLVTAAVLVVGYLYGSSKGSMKFLAVLLLVGYMALLFSFGSRRFALAPVLFALGVFLASNTKWTRRAVPLAGLVSLVFLPLPLEFRSLPMHGLIPYSQALLSFDFFEADWMSALNNVLVSFGIIGITAYVHDPFSWEDLWMSVNPLPGGLAGWYDEVHRYLLNPFTPVAGIGELGNVGTAAVVTFGIGIGMALAWIELAIRRQIQSGAYIYCALLVGMCALFALQMSQYTLRSAMRLLLYLLVVEAGRRVLSVVMVRRRDKGPAAAPSTH